MAAIVVFEPGVDWTASGGVFDWTLEYLIRHVSDPAAAERLQEIVDNNLGSLWLADFDEDARQEILDALSTGLVEEAEQELPETDHKKPTLENLQELAALAQSAS